MLSRVYSSALVVTTQPNDGYAAVFRVPAGRRWVVKAVTWCEIRPSPYGSGAYWLLADGEWITADAGTIRSTVIQDSKLDYTRPGEWQGRLTFHEGDALILGNGTEPYDSIHPISISVHGYDFTA